MYAVLNLCLEKSFHFHGDGIQTRIFGSTAACFFSKSQINCISHLNVVK